MHEKSVDYFPSVYGHFECIIDLFLINKKNELKKATSHDFNGEFREELLGKAMTLNHTSAGSERRLSEPFQSRLVKILEKKKDVKSDKLENIFKIFRKDKISKTKLEKELNNFQAQCSLLDESLEKMTTKTAEETNLKHEFSLNEPTELKLNDFKIIYEHLDSSFDEISNNLDESTIIRFEKFLNKKIASSNQNYSMMDQSIDFTEPHDVVPDLPEIEPVELLESSSSKSSIISEEGYFSNHDSSISTITNEKQANECKFTDIKNTMRTYSSPELINDFNAYQASLDLLTNDNFNISGIYTLSESISDDIEENFELKYIEPIEPPLEFRESVTPKSIGPPSRKCLNVQVQINEFEKRARFSIRNLRKIYESKESQKPPEILMPIKQLVTNFERFSRNMNSSNSELDDENKENETMNEYEHLKENSFDTVNTSRITETLNTSKKIETLNTSRITDTLNTTKAIGTLNKSKTIDTLNTSKTKEIKAKLKTKTSHEIMKQRVDTDFQNLEEFKINVKDLISKFEFKI